MRAIIAITSSVFVSGCATVFSGYYTDVEIRNAPASVSVRTADGVQLPTRTWSIVVNNENAPIGEPKYITRVDSSRVVVKLRRASQHILVLTSGEKERRVAVHGKVNPWVFGIDLLFGIVPAVFDGITGNWYYFSPIEFGEH